MIDKGLQLCGGYTHYPGNVSFNDSDMYPTPVAAYNFIKVPGHRSDCLHQTDIMAVDQMVI